MLISDTSRRIAHRPPELQLPVVKRDVVLSARQLNAVVLGIERLDDRLASLFTAAGPARNLSQQLERPLGRTKIRHAQADVRRHDAYERDSRKIVSLRDHLGADEHVDIAAARNRVQQRRERRLSGGSRRGPVARRARPATVRRISASTRSVPNPVCSRYGPAQSWTSGRHARRVVAVVTARPASRRLRRGPRETHCSWGTRAFRHIAGRRPPSRTRVCSTARALAPGSPTRRRDRFSQRADSGRHPVQSSHIPRACRRQSPPATADPLTRRCEHDPLVPADHGVVIALHRRRR